MNKNIKITEKQYRRLLEADENDFPYITDSDTIPYDGQKNISVDGKKTNGETNPDFNTTTDMLQQKLTPQSWNRYRMYGNTNCIPTMMREGIDVTDKEDNTADDFDETNGFDCVAKLKEQVQIPKLTQDRVRLLLDSTKGLNVKQQAVILYDLINEFTSQSTSNQARKVFDSLLREFQKRTGLSRTIEKELENAD